ncbi:MULTISPECIES: DUF6882 domain-containing protein [unclassified Corynebacterium]|uniref:DUF6882 domain-containing protein n=1 Tax=unclassified Corynebacterium TaxID=2624378 RepID=UPI0029CA6449|nr:MULTISPECIES: DUF6882 domain-containing protein [unclassified Corynebacterium]WPF66816.1 hypothetical protein OLX12_03580 [Corynebacterium sp. 22KM0430]WPF69304.1 hypothetical protein OLW90_03575 [Corynebacterium sp. 21KM1197]
MSNLIARAQGLAALRQIRGPLEFTGPSATDDTPDAPVSVLAGRTALRGTRVAEVQGDTWRWLTASRGGTEPLRQELLDQAGLLFDAAPAVLAPRLHRSKDAKDSASRMVVALHLDASGVPLRPALIEGLATQPERGREEVRGIALLRDLPLVEAGNTLTLAQQPIYFDGDTALQVPAPGSPTLAQVYSDAAYLSAEHQFFFHSQHPAQQVRLDLASGTAEGMRARVLGIFHGDSFTWGWADDQLPAAAQAPSRTLLAFGQQHGIIPLVRPRIPLTQATRWDLAVIAKPILGAWTHAVAGLAPGVTALLLLEAPHLHLPPLSTEVQREVIAQPLPDFADEQRALRAYTTARGAA